MLTMVRTPYNYDRDAVSRETGLADEGESMTQQSFKDDCDINVIVRRFRLTGRMPQGLVAPTYALYEDVFDFHTAMNAVAEARETFDQMPADVRAKFQNDPGKFVDFCSDPKNSEELVKMGLASARPVVDNTPAPNGSAKEKGDVGDSKGGANSSDKAGGEPAKAG